jgi:transposase
MLEIMMRGSDVRTESLFSYVSCEARVPTGHPLRPIRTIVDQALEVISPDFERLYSKIGRPSIPPEKLLPALLLQVFYSVRSERQLMEQLDYNLMFRWFVGMSMDAPIWDVTVFTKNRDRLLEGRCGIDQDRPALDGANGKPEILGRDLLRRRQHAGSDEQDKGRYEDAH